MVHPKYQGFRSGELVESDDRSGTGLHSSELVSIFRTGRSSGPDGPALDNGLLQETRPWAAFAGGEDVSSCHLSSDFLTDRQNDRTQCGRFSGFEANR